MNPLFPDIPEPVFKTHTNVPKRILLELQYLPPVQYFTKFMLFEEVWIEQHENYQKGSYRNRCHLAGPNQVQRLSIPLEKGKHQRLPIREVRINYREPWQHQHWQTIRTAYGNSPFFLHYEPELRPFYERSYAFLFDFNLDLLQCLIRLLGIPNHVHLTNAYCDPPPDHTLDFRNAIFPKKQHQKKDPAFRPASYVQVFAEKHGFLPNLSILDLLFCTGPQAILTLRASILKFKSESP